MLPIEIFDAWQVLEHVECDVWFTMTFQFQCKFINETRTMEVTNNLRLRDCEFQLKRVF